MSNVIKSKKASETSIVEEFLAANNPVSLHNAVNIRETGHKYELQIIAPGFKKGDFSITADGGLLTISAETDDEKSDEEGTFTRREFSRSSFGRAFKLPENVLTDHISASYDHGILTLDLKKNDRFFLGKKHVAID
ncbi:Hsp20/alpha crystallin family protein [Mucilaginibacter sp. FT3.2]|uniref:Hsp20/alpha crystallin family protein n=1 Tax=Mucilaginibacter sp. FT3.2 TaxID=2723090 RepID=UPI0016177980|nr:Hsp20/alpha crystallin family protein [Mucilaginibacter sp. FT3.2]MBB6233683.1 HSP20 family protein [Mucilaginibacter sp. FT3.2]